MPSVRVFLKMSKAIVSVSNFNPTNITFSDPRVLDSGGKSVWMNYTYDANTRKNLTVQVGSLTLPFGMNVFDKQGPVKYSVDLSLRGYEDNAKVKSIYDMFNALDEYMIDMGVANSKKWFKSQLSRDVVKAFYTPTLRWAKGPDGEIKSSYPPTIKLQLRQREGKFDVEVYDEKRNELKDKTLDEVLVKGSQVTCLIQCTSVWFAGSKYGLSWKALQIRMDKIPDSIRGYSIQDEDGDSAPVVTARVSKSAPAPAPTNKFSALEDEEEEEEDEDFRGMPALTPAKASVVAAVMPPAPAPAPAVVDDDAEDVEPVALPKKVVTKSKVVKTVVKK